MSVLKFPHLFEPLIIGNTVFRNRIFASPQGSSYLDTDQCPTPEVTVYYERKPSAVRQPPAWVCAMWIRSPA